MRLARWIYLVAAIYGLLILAAGLFAERTLDASGAQLAHPEFYYGFHGSAIVWQLVFLLIVSDPVRFRVLMPITFLEKAAFLVSNLVLLATGRMSMGGPFIGGLIDGGLMVLFVLAWLRTPRSAAAKASL
jgi:hypothetical protein